MGILEFLLIAFGLLSLVLFLLLRRAMNLNATLEENIATLGEENSAFIASNNSYDAWFEELKTRLVDAYLRIKTIDASGHFEADDEVGYFFTELKSLIERLHELGIIDEFEKTDIDEGTKRITSEELKEILAKRKVASSEKKEG